MPLPDFLGAPKTKQIIHNRYEVKEVLGVGTYGSVYKVRDGKTGRTAALKTIKLTVAGDAGGAALGIGEKRSELETALKEARLLAQLSHVSIVRLTDAFEDGAQFHILMDFCEEGTLDDAVQDAASIRRPFEFWRSLIRAVVVSPVIIEVSKTVRLKAENLLCWAVQLSAALAYIHKRKILHRDLKSKNVFLDKRLKGEKWPGLKIGDFGISRQLAGTLDEASTCIGTPYYFAPELFKQQGYNAKADVWALGCLVFEMRLLRHPFHPADNLPQLMHKVCSKEPDFSAWPASEALRGLSEWCLKKGPSKRPSAEELLRSPALFDHARGHRSDLHPDA